MLTPTSPALLPKIVAATLSATLMILLGCRKTHSTEVVASVNGHPIFRTDLNRAYAVQESQKQGHGAETLEEADRDRIVILRAMIDEEIIEQRAAQMKLLATNEEVEAQVAELRARYTTEQFQHWLQQTNQTLDGLRLDLRRSITIDRLLNKEINSKITVTDAEISQYLHAHMSDFNLTESRYHLAEIVVTSLPMQGPDKLRNSKTPNETEAKRRIQILSNRLDSGEDFGLVAMNSSEDPQTAPNGGDLGFLTESQLRSDPRVFDAIQRLKADQVTAILPLHARPGSDQVTGYAILKLISRETPGQRNLTDPLLQQSIRVQLRNDRSQLLKLTYLEMLRDQARVENHLAAEIYKRNAK